MNRPAAERGEDGANLTGRVGLQWLPAGGGDLRPVNCDRTQARSESHAQRDSVRGFLLEVYCRQGRRGTLVYGVGRLETGETFGIIDDRWQPAFYVRTAESSRAGPLVNRVDAELKPCGRTTMDGEPVQRVTARSIGTLRNLAEALQTSGIRTYEADVPAGRQYLIEHGLRGSVRLSGPSSRGVGVDRVYRRPTLVPSEWEPELTVLVLDIETNTEATEVYAVSLVWTGAEAGDRAEEIHLVGVRSAADPAHVQCHAAEAGLLTALVRRIRDLDPDVLTGWNVVDFDLPVLQRRCAACGVPFTLGRSREESWCRERDRWGGGRVVVSGRQVLDALHLVRATLHRFDDFRLDTVAKAILGRGKTLAETDTAALPAVIERAYRHDRAAFCEYCLEDSRLVRDVLEAERLISLTVRRSLLTGLPLERAWGSIAAFEFLYLTELHRRGMVAPTVGVDRDERAGTPGGLVLSPTTGLHRNVFVCDFKSLYPSLMRTFNIDPLAYVRAPQASAAEVITAPNGARFHREPGILPQLLERLSAGREQAKAAGDSLASYTYKILMNSFYGVLATDSCRFASGNLAGAITEFGQLLLGWVKDLLEGEGYAVLYGDTDSVFVVSKLPDDAEARQLLSCGRELCARITDRLADHLQERYRVTSHLELEFEKLYRRFFLPPARGDSQRGRAKGYAGLRVDESGEELEIVGMEAARRDWTELAHAVQRDLLNRLFHDADAAELAACVREWVRAVRAGEKDDMLVYRKGLRKPVASYTRSLPPHVKAARLLTEPSGVIHYVVTRDGPQPVGRVTAPVDYAHYVDKQIAPLVRTIARVSGLDAEAVLTGEKRLFE